MSTLDSKIPEGPLADKWTKYKDHINLVNPANKRNIDIIVVGTGLAGGSAAATLLLLKEVSMLLKTIWGMATPTIAFSMIL